MRRGWTVPTKNGLPSTVTSTVSEANNADTRLTAQQIPVTAVTKGLAGPRPPDKTTPGTIADGVTADEISLWMMQGYA